MKKIVYLLLALTVSVCLFGCGNTGAGDNEQESKNPQQNPTQAEGGAVIDEDVIRSLMESNLDCMRHIFSLGTLPIEGDFDPSQNIYPVKTDRFKDYAAFETYIRSIYTKEWADTLLNNYPYEGVQKYLNKDGKLYVDMNYDAGKGYYVDWSEYTVEIVSQTETKCDFKLTAQIEEPAAEPVKTDYVVEGSAYLENGTWLFDKIYS